MFFFEKLKKKSQNENFSLEANLDKKYLIMPKMFFLNYSEYRQVRPGQFFLYTVHANSTSRIKFFIQIQYFTSSQFTVVFFFFFCHILDYARIWSYQLADEVPFRRELSIELWLCVGGALV